MQKSQPLQAAQELNTECFCPLPIVPALQLAAAHEPPHLETTHTSPPHSRSMAQSPGLSKSNVVCGFYCYCQQLHWYQHISTSSTSDSHEKHFKGVTFNGREKNSNLHHFLQVNLSGTFSNRHSYEQEEGGSAGNHLSSSTAVSRKMNPRASKNIKTYHFLLGKLFLSFLQLN